MPNVGHWSNFVGHDCGRRMSCQNPSAAEPTVWSAIHVRHLAKRLQGMATFQMQPNWCFPSKRAMEKNPRVLPHHSLNWLVHVGIHFLPSTISQFLAAASSRKAEWEGLFEVPFKDGWLQARNMKLFRFVTLTGQICDLKPPTRFPENRITWPGKPACPDRRQSTLVTPPARLKSSGSLSPGWVSLTSRHCDPGVELCPCKPGGDVVH